MKAPARLNLLAMLTIFPFSCNLGQSARTTVSEALSQHNGRIEKDATSYSQTPQTTYPANDSQIGEKPEPRSTLALREFIAEALRENPDIQAAAAVAQVKAERVAQVVSLPDPMLGTKTFVEPVRTADGDQHFTLDVVQRFPIPQKLDQAGRMAMEETRMAVERLEEVRNRIVADVKRTYFKLYMIQKEIELLDADQTLVRDLVEVARAQFRAGKRSQSDVLRGEVELANLEARLIALRYEQKSAHVTLNELLNRRAKTVLADFPEIDIRAAEYIAEDVFARAVETNPTLRRMGHQIDRDRLAVTLSKLERWPEFSLGFEWMYMEPRDAFRPPPDPVTGQRPAVSTMSEEGTDSWAILFGFNVPIWLHRIDAGIRAAERQLAASQQEYVASRNEIERDFFDAMHRFLARQELARLYRGTIIPQAEQTYRVSLAAYTVGSVDFLGVIEDHRKWLALLIEYQQAVGQLEIAVADLEQVVGRSLDEIPAN